MKKRLLTLPLMLFTMSLVCVAQNRVQSKSPVKKSSATVASIPLTGPAIVDNHLAFLGISLGESTITVKAKLVEKGMKVEKNIDGTTNINMMGNIDGVQSRVIIGVTNDNKVFSMSANDKKSYRLPQAKTRYNSLLSKIQSIYGKGAFDVNEADMKRYIIKTSKGVVTVELYNEDEMDGASESYCIAIGLSENW